MVWGPRDGGGHALAAVGGRVDVARAGGSPLPCVKALIDVLGTGKRVERAGLELAGWGTRQVLCQGGLAHCSPQGSKDRTLLGPGPLISNWAGGCSAEPSGPWAQGHSVVAAGDRPQSACWGITCEYGERVPRDWRQQEAKRGGERKRETARG